MRRFTLIELIISIVVLGILLAIVLINISSNKKDSIRVAVQSNIKIIQTASDSYSLHNKEKVATVNSLKPTLQTPQLIDIPLLVKEGYIKKDLDLKKINEQYYWLDSYGTVWGSTNPLLNNITKINTTKGSELSFSLNGKDEGYKIYKISLEKSLSSLTKRNLVADSNKQSIKSYKEIIEYHKEEDSSVLYALPYEDDSIYLVSTIDEYGLETAPKGLGIGFSPLIREEGTFIYEVENIKEMTFINFWDWIETPGDSTVSYRFSVKNKSNGEYNEWLTSFNEILEHYPNGYGIQIEITMKGDLEGNLPSIYDLQVLYSYSKNKTTSTTKCYINPTECSPIDDICLIFSSLCEHLKCENGICSGSGTGGSGSGTGGSGGGTGGSGSGTGGSSGGTGGSGGDTGGSGGGTGGSGSGTGGSGSGTGGSGSGTGGSGSGTGGSGGGTGGSGGGTGGSGSSFCEIMPSLCKINTENNLCGNNHTKTSIKNNLYYLSYNFTLDQNEKLSSIHIPNVSSKEGSVLKEVFIEFSNKGSEYKMAESIMSIPSGSCINIVYVYEKISGFPPQPPATCMLGEDCPETCEDLNTCPTIEEEFTTVKTMKFFAHSAVGETSKWLNYSAKEVLPKGTRIVYSFSLGRLGKYGEDRDTFPTNESSQSIMAIAYLQVENSYLDKNIKPSLEKFSFKSSNGEQEVLGNNTPQIYFSVKDNVFEELTDETLIDWHFEANPPDDLEVIDYEWSIGNANTKNQTYSSGIHVVKLRVKYSDNEWSEWAVYNLEVIGITPKVEITMTVNGKSNPNTIFAKDTVYWSYNSTTPSSEIKEVQWTSNKNATYTAGTYQVGVRIQNNKGQWSEYSYMNFKVISSLDSLITSKILRGLPTSSGSQKGTSLITNTATHKKVTRNSAQGSLYMSFSDATALTNDDLQGFYFKNLNLLNGYFIFTTKDCHPCFEAINNRNISRSEYRVGPSAPSYNPFDFSKATNVLIIYSKSKKSYISILENQSGVQVISRTSPSASGIGTGTMITMASSESVADLTAGPVGYSPELKVDGFYYLTNQTMLQDILNYNFN